MTPNTTHVQIQRPSPESLPPTLRNLSYEVRGQLDDTLSNDQESTDEELKAFFVEECGIDKGAAVAALTFRPQFFTNPLFQLFDQSADGPTENGNVTERKA